MRAGQHHHLHLAALRAAGVGRREKFLANRGRFAISPAPARCLTGPARRQRRGRGTREQSSQPRSNGNRSKNVKERRRETDGSWPWWRYSSVRFRARPRCTMPKVAFRAAPQQGNHTTTLSECLVPPCEHSFQNTSAKAPALESLKRVRFREREPSRL